MVSLVAESPVTPSVSEKVNYSVPSVSMVSSASGTVQKSDATLFPVRADNYLPLEVIPTAVPSVAMSTVACTSGLTECQSGPVTYPVLGGTTTVQALPAFPGVHLPVSVVPTLVPVTSTLVTTTTTTTQFKQPPAFNELRK